MRTLFTLLLSLTLFAPVLLAQGHMIPRDRTLPPMLLVNHRVKVMLEDQVAVTTVKQTFRNQANRPLEAIYTFNVPKGASVREFSMMVNGKKVKGELVEAARAKSIYTEIVRRTMDPGLLEYLGADLIQMSVFPVPPSGDQEVEVSFTSLVNKQEEAVEYLYPLRAQSNILRMSGEFSFEMELKAGKPIQSIYSPTHPISFNRKSDRHAIVYFDKSFVALDRDLQLFYTTGKDDIGLTMLQHRPASGDGYALLMLAPRAEIAQDKRVPRDIVFVLDTSGSMRDDHKIDQAKKALKFGLDSLKPGDRFNVLNFATTINSFDSKLVEQGEAVAAAKKWVDALEPTGGTAIDDAMKEALKYQPNNRARQFNVVFLTDGKPTVGETNVERILTNVDKIAAPDTRIFTFGVGYDLDAGFLDRLAEKNRGTSTYVRPNEDMEVKVSYFFTQINQPVLTNLKLVTGTGVRLMDVYPPQLPDLFHGGQLVVLARTQGTGRMTIKLTGQVGETNKEFNYDVEVQDKPEPKQYVEDLWARRKVGYLLDQIRMGGEKKELVDEVVILAKKYGIATPYTSYLVVPDDVPMPGRRQHNVTINSDGSPRPSTVGVGGSFAGGSKGSGSGLGGGDLGGGGLGGGGFGGGLGGRPGEKAASATESVNLVRKSENTAAARGLNDQSADKRTLDLAKDANEKQQQTQTQQGQLGVDYAYQLNNMKNQNQQGRGAQRSANKRSCIEVNGVWIDEQFKKDTPTLNIKTMSNAYFKLLEKKPEMKEVFSLSPALVWITPSGTALVIDPKEGKEEISDEEITKLFTK
ncbi:MAG TPA: VIT and VWA domain-containing protein [Gemmatales bacterium]|nr:VIT and VWA domain-containing protein [Gemmatales bacterium]